MNKYIMLTAMIVLLHSIANCQSNTTTKTHTVTYVVNNILELDFDNSSQNLSFTFTTASDFENGKTNLSAAGLRVRSNKAWTVNVKANTANFATTGAGETNIPANKLSVRKNGTSALVALSTSDQSLATGSKGGFGTNSFLIDYVANPGYIAPATYTLGVTYTVTAP